MPRRPAPRLSPTRRDAVETRARLLKAAGQEFGRHGFQAASLRAICRRASVNLGAVAYYFGGKEALYREVLVESHRALIADDHVPARDDFDDPREALRAWIRFAAQVILVRRPANPYLGRLVVHELIRPTPALDELVATVLRPLRQHLAGIVAALLEREAEHPDIGPLVNLTVFLLVQHELGRPILERLGFPRPDTPARVEALAEQIYRFALAGILAFKGTPGAPGPADGG